MWPKQFQATYLACRELQESFRSVKNHYIHSFYLPKEERAVAEFRQQTLERLARKLLEGTDPSHEMSDIDDEQLGHLTVALEKLRLRLTHCD